MRNVLLWLVVFWFALIAEQTRSDIFLPGTMLLSVSCGCIFWSSRAAGILIAGGGLVPRLVIHPEHVTAVCCLLAAGSWLIVRVNRKRRWSDERRRMQWISPVLTLLFAFAGYLAPVLVRDVPPPSFFARWLGTGLTVTALVMIAGRLCDELGLRRQVDVLSGPR